jgi:hypothetical protein
MEAEPQAEDGILVDVRCGSELGYDVRPVRVHFVRKDRRERCVGALVETPTAREVPLRDASASRLHRGYGSSIDR